MPAWLWLGLPLAYYLLVYGAALLLEQPQFYQYFTGEMCVTEIVTVLVLVVAVVAGLGAMRDLRALDDGLLLCWIALGTLGCFYFGGEEASWGQWYLRWSTPEAWQALNNQQETNLHNLETLGPLLDQLPRALLTLGAFIGGIVIPLYLKLRRQQLVPARRWYWIWPTAITLPVAVIAVFLARADRRIGDLLDHVWPFYDMRTGELKELFLAYFLMLYLLSLRLRLMQLRSATQA